MTTGASVKGEKVDRHVKSVASRRMKIVITGGHHNSALVVAKKIMSMGHQVEWIGHRRASAGDTNDSAEYIEVTEAGIPFHDLIAGKTSMNPRTLARIPLGFYRASRMLGRIRPDAVLSFGGYLGLAASVAGAARGIPLFVHEQTMITGKANKAAAFLARRVYLTWEDSLRYYSHTAARVVGLPLRAGFISARKKEKLFSGTHPTVFILCGKQGSTTVNKIIFAHIHELLTSYNVIHQTGTSSATGDYEHAQALKESLPDHLSGKYLPHGYIGEKDIARYMLSSDLVIGRSGAHVTYELGLLGKKSILIPFLATHGREQLLNARFLEKAGIARILPQSALSYPALKREMQISLRQAEPSPLDLPTDAAETLAADLLENLR